MINDIYINKFPIFRPLTEETIEKARHWEAAYLNTLSTLTRCSDSKIKQVAQVAEDALTSNIIEGSALVRVIRRRIKSEMSANTTQAILGVLDRLLKSSSELKNLLQPHLVEWVRTLKRTAVPDQAMFFSTVTRSWNGLVKKNISTEIQKLLWTKAGRTLYRVKDSAAWRRQPPNSNFAEAVKQARKHLKIQSSKGRMNVTGTSSAAVTAGTGARSAPCRPTPAAVLPSGSRAMCSFPEISPPATSETSSPAVPAGTKAPDNDQAIKPNRLQLEDEAILITNNRYQVEHISNDLWKCMYIEVRRIIKIEDWAYVVNEILSKPQYQRVSIVMIQAVIEDMLEMKTTTPPGGTVRTFITPVKDFNIDEHVNKVEQAQSEIMKHNPGITFIIVGPAPVDIGRYNAKLRREATIQAEDIKRQIDFYKIFLEWRTKVDNEPKFLYARFCRNYLNSGSHPSKISARLLSEGKTYKHSTLEDGYKFNDRGEDFLQKTLFTTVKAFMRTKAIKWQQKYR